MSRGWESKNVESQQDLQQAESLDKGLDTPKNDRARNLTANPDQQRRLQELKLQRERVLSERTSSPHRRSALSSALADIEEKLAELGWTVHL